jgi:hypothetical protein
MMPTMSGVSLPAMTSFVIEARRFKWEEAVCICTVKESTSTGQQQLEAGSGLAYIHKTCPRLERREATPLLGKARPGTDGGQDAFFAYAGWQVGTKRLLMMQRPGDLFKRCPSARQLVSGNATPPDLLDSHVGVMPSSKPHSALCTLADLHAMPHAWQEPSGNTFSTVRCLLSLEQGAHCKTKIWKLIDMVCLICDDAVISHSQSICGIDKNCGKCETQHV